MFSSMVKSKWSLKNQYGEPQRKQGRGPNKVKVNKQPSSLSHIATFVSLAFCPFSIHSHNWKTVLDFNVFLSAWARETWHWASCKPWIVFYLNVCHFWNATPCLASERGPEESQAARDGYSTHTNLLIISSGWVGKAGGGGMQDIISRLNGFFVLMIFLSWCCKQSLCMRSSTAAISAGQKLKKLSQTEFLCLGVDDRGSETPKLEGTLCLKTLGWQVRLTYSTQENILYMLRSFLHFACRLFI